ncbi:MAG: aminodeoxychorismate/anthranilate synthase component II [Finegoldia sp.]|nr:aminodeoxychorismate/anthranilate synthase component II [Finegoldia sp.]
MILIIDNYDSFTYNIVAYLNILKEEVVVKKKDELTLADIDKLNPEMLVVSPGPKSPAEAGISVDVFKANKYPILGVCLGHQAFAYANGLRIIKGDRPMHGKISTIYHDRLGLYKDIENPVKVMRYHSLVVDKSQFIDGRYKDIKITSMTEDGVIMGLRDSKHKIETVQFHPESIGTDFGLKMMANFLNEVRNDTF